MLSSKMACRLICMLTAYLALAPLQAAAKDAATCDIEVLPRTGFTDDRAVLASLSIPANCPLPWSKATLKLSFDVPEGRQFDRTARLWLNDFAVFTGTTQEPSRDVAPTWTIERDISEIVSSFKGPILARFELPNFLDDKHRSPVFASAKLRVMSAPYSKEGAQAVWAHSLTPQVQRLDSVQSRHVWTTALPTNLTQLEVVLLAQPQGEDEFFYQCRLPEIKTWGHTLCPRGPLRWVEVLIDDTSAGLAPVKPWIYSGGINPGLWRPLVGIETYDLEPTRLDLTPFLGLLNDGRPHRIAIGVNRGRNHYALTAYLVGMRDPDKPVVTGRLLVNTLSAPALATQASRGNTEREAARLEASYHQRGELETSSGVIVTDIHRTLGTKALTEWSRDWSRVELKTDVSQTTLQSLRGSSPRRKFWRERWQLKVARRKSDWATKHQSAEPPTYGQLETIEVRQTRQALGGLADAISTQVDIRRTVGGTPTASTAAQLVRSNPNLACKVHETRAVDGRITATRCLDR